MQKVGAAVLKGGGRFPIQENETNTHSAFNEAIANQNDIDALRGRVLRRQSSSTQKVAHDVNVASTAGANTVTTSRKREGTVSPDSSNSNSTPEQDYDHEGNEHTSKKSRKNVTFDGASVAEASAAAANSESDNSKRLRTAAQLAREQRSRRRQAALGTDGADSAVPASLPRKPDNRITHKKKVPGSSSSSTETDTNVVRVPMLTGTLVLYRGSKPRAVFIRRV